MSKSLEELEQIVDSLVNNPPMKDHRHTGFDVSQVYFSDVTQKKVWVPWTVVGTDASAAGNYGTFFISPFTCVLNDFKEVHQVVGSDSGNVAINLEKLTGTQAPDAGSLMLGTALSLKVTANTVQTATLSATLANRNLAIGDRLCLKDTGALTAVSNVSVLVELVIT